MTFEAIQPPIRMSNGRVRSFPFQAAFVEGGLPFRPRSNGCAQISANDRTGQIKALRDGARVRIAVTDAVREPCLERRQRRAVAPLASEFFTIRIRPEQRI